jgi:hypothetical protein
MLLAVDPLAVVADLDGATAGVVREVKADGWSGIERMSTHPDERNERRAVTPAHGCCPCWTASCRQRSRRA